MRGRDRMSASTLGLREWFTPVADGNDRNYLVDFLASALASIVTRRPSFPYDGL
jgi:hypothetical protein